MKQAGMLAALILAVAGLTSLYSVPTQAQQPDAHREHFVKCARACAECQVECDACFHHCAALIASGKTGHAKTMHACVDCAESCALASKLAARQSHFSSLACEGCAKTCEECAKECEKFKDDKQMAHCAKSCHDCAKSCRAMIDHMKS